MREASETEHDLAGRLVDAPQHSTQPASLLVMMREIRESQIRLEHMFMERAASMPVAAKRVDPFATQDGMLIIHIRILFDRGSHYEACVVNDAWSPKTGWRFVTTLTAPCLRVEKSDALTKVCFTTVLRVPVDQRLSALFVKKFAPSGSVKRSLRTNKARSSKQTIDVSAVVVAETCEPDLESACALAGVARAEGEDVRTWAGRCHVKM